MIIKDLYEDEYIDTLASVTSICKGMKGTVAENLKQLRIDEKFLYVRDRFIKTRKSKYRIDNDTRKDLIKKSNALAEDIIAADKKRRKK